MSSFRYCKSIFLLSQHSIMLFQQIWPIALSKNYLCLVNWNDTLSFLALPWKRSWGVGGLGIFLVVPNWNEGQRTRGNKGGLLLPDLNSNGSSEYPGRGQTGEKGPQGKLEMVSNRGTVRQQSWGLQRTVSFCKLFMTFQMCMSERCLRAANWYLWPGCL